MFKKFETRAAAENFVDNNYDGQQCVSDAADTVTGNVDLNWLHMYSVEHTVI